MEGEIETRDRKSKVLLHIFNGCRNETVQNSEDAPAETEWKLCRGGGTRAPKAHPRGNCLFCRENASLPLLPKALWLNFPYLAAVRQPKPLLRALLLSWPLGCVALLREVESNHAKWVNMSISGGILVSPRTWGRTRGGGCGDKGAKTPISGKKTSLTEAPLGFQVLGPSLG